MQFAFELKGLVPFPSSNKYSGAYGKHGKEQEELFVVHELQRWSVLFCFFFFSLK